MTSGNSWLTALVRHALLVSSLFLFPVVLAAQSSSALPDAPQSQPQASPAPSSTGQAAPAETPAEREARARKELKQEEQQRMLGVVPLFNVSFSGHAAPLTARQKFQLMFKSSTDPWIFFLTAADGGISMAGDEYASYGQGVEGYSKYWAAAYADTFDGNFWGNALLPSLWHEDPRYFRMGQGNFFRRAGYSALTTVWCKRDNGSWGPNYGNVVGNFIAGGISNVYYPANDRGVELTFARGASVTYEGIVGAELAEFWPDIARRMLRNRQRKAAAQSATQAAPANPPTVDSH